MSRASVEKFKITKKRREFLEAVREKYGNITQITRKQVEELKESRSDLPHPAWLTYGLQAKERFRLGRGVYALPPLPEDEVAINENIVINPVNVGGISENSQGSFREDFSNEPHTEGGESEDFQDSESVEDLDPFNTTH